MFYDMLRLIIEANEMRRHEMIVDGIEYRVEHYGHTISISDCTGAEIAYAELDSEQEALIGDYFLNDDTGDTFDVEGFYQTDLYHNFNEAAQWIISTHPQI
jgi:hypothetical protein